MNVYKNFVPVLFAVAFVLLTACGGEDCKGSECDPTDDTAVTDDVVTDNEQPDDVQTDDIMTDEEPTDADTTPINCADDETCKEICKNFLAFAGNWDRVESTGSITITLSVENSECVLSVTGKWTFTWKGTSLPLECAEYAPASYFFYLVGMENDKMVWIQSSSMERCQTQTGPKITFTKK